MSPDRIRQKATAYTMAWARIFRTEPSLHNIMLGLAPALFETAAGDAWKGPDGLLDTEDDPNNWGATTLRPLNASELAAVAAASIKPTLGPGREERARAAEKAIRAAGLPLPRGEIHCDSRPAKTGTVVYFTFFATFDDAVGGAAYFIRILAGTPEHPKPAKVVLESPESTERDLAAAMYSQHYYTGVHLEPSRNIDDYTAALRRQTPRIQAALMGTNSTNPPPAPVTTPFAEGSQGPTVLRLQQRIMKHDGSWGPVTTAALKAVQKKLGLPETGVLDEPTKKALKL